MTVTGTAVRARGLRKIYRPARYREVTALNGLDLDIGAGEIVALPGPDGADRRCHPGHGTRHAAVPRASLNPAGRQSADGRANRPAGRESAGPPPAESVTGRT
jgi:hypothetical protein